MGSLISDLWLRVPSLTKYFYFGEVDEKLLELTDPVSIDRVIPYKILKILGPIGSSTRKIG